MRKSNVLVGSSTFLMYFLLLLGSAEASVSWTEPVISGTLPDDRMHFASVLYNDTLVICGGWDGTNLDDVWELDFSASPTRWSNTVASGQSGSLPARHCHSAVLSGDKMVVFAGQTTGYSNDVWELHLVGASKGTWSQVSTTGGPPTVRRYHTALNYDGNMVIFGGKTPSVVNDVWKLNLASNTWVEVTISGSSPAARQGHTAVLYGDKMVVFGGANELGSSNYNDVWQLELTTNTWSQLSPTGGPPPTRHSGVAIMYGTKMMIFGGKGESRLNDVWQLDLSSNTWALITTSGEAPVARSWPTAVLYGAKMTVFGGSSGPGTYLNDLWSFDLSVLCQIPATGDVTLTSDCILYSQIVVTGKLNITGNPDANGILPKIIGGGSNRLFKVESGGELVVMYLNLTGGMASGSGDEGKGGAVFICGSGSNLHAIGSAFENNVAGLIGGGIYASDQASVVLSASSVNHNRAEGSGHCP